MLRGKLLLWFLLITFKLSQAVADIELTIIHVKTIKSHFFETDERDQPCESPLKNLTANAEKRNCSGGIARMVTKIKEIRMTDKNVIVLSTGDFFLNGPNSPFQGWKLASNLIPYLHLNATVLGNQDLTQGSLETAAFILSLNTPVLCCNLIGRKGSFWEDYVHGSTMLDIGAKKIGLIGFMAPSEKLAGTGFGLQFADEVTSIDREVKKLKASGIDLIVALGYSSHEMDKHVMKQVPEVDLLIDGHSNLIIYKSLSLSVPERSISWLHHGKYQSLVNLQMSLDDKGKIKGILDFKVNMIDINPDSETQAVLLDAETEILNQQSSGTLANVILGRTAVELTGNSQVCRLKECSMGNFITDAMFHAFVHWDVPPEGWNRVNAAIWKAGDIRSSIQPGDMTLEDLAYALNTDDKVGMVNMSGSTLRLIMEQSVEDYDTTKAMPSGTFLQVSGIKVVYNLRGEPGMRVASLRVRCSTCKVPHLVRIRKNHTYGIVMTSYLKAKVIAEFETHGPNSTSEEIPLIDVLAKYLKDVKPIVTEMEDRILFRKRRSSDFAVKIQQISDEDNSNTDFVFHKSLKTASSTFFPSETTPIDKNSEILKVSVEANGRIIKLTAINPGQKTIIILLALLIIFIAVALIIVCFNKKSGDHKISSLLGLEINQNGNCYCNLCSRDLKDLPAGVESRPVTSKPTNENEYPLSGIESDPPAKSSDLNDKSERQERECQTEDFKQRL